MRLALAGHPALFETLLENLAHGEKFSAAAAGLLVEVQIAGGNVDEALDSVRRRVDALSTDLAGERPGLSVDGDNRVDQVLAAVESVAAAGFRQEAADLLARFPDKLGNHPDVERFAFHLSAALDEEAAERAVGSAMEELDELDTQTARTRRMEYARVLSVNGRYPLASEMAEPATESSAYDSVERALLFLVRNAYADDDSGRIGELSRQLLDRLPDQLQARTNVGRALANLGLDEKAVRKLAPVAERAPTRDHVRRALDVAQAAGDASRSKQLLAKYLRIANSPLSDLKTRFEQSIDRQDAELAEAMIEPYERTYPARLEVRLARARLAFRFGNVERGREIVGSYLESVDYEPSAVQRALAFLHSNDLWAEQLHLVLEQTDRGSLTTESLRYIGYALVNLERSERAEDLLDRSVDSAPDPAEAATEIARSLFENDHYQTALRYAERAVELAPGRPVGKLYRGLAQLALGEVEGAKPDLEDGLDSGINPMYALHNAGRAALKAGEPKLAARYLRKLARTPNANDRVVLFPVRLALDAYVRSDHAREGVAFLEENFPRIAAGTSIATQELVRNISGLYERAGLHERAYEIYRHGIDRELVRDPDGTLMPVYLNNLAYTYSTTDRHVDRGFELARRAVASAQARTPSYLDTLGWLNYRKGNLAEAEADVRRALRTATGGPGNLVELYEHLVDIRRKRGFDVDAFWMQRFSDSLK